MKGPRRWLDAPRTSVHHRLMVAVVNEPLPDDVALRAAKHFGVSAALLQTSIASGAEITTMAAGGKATAAVKSTLWVAFGKAMTIGLTTGGLLVGAAHWKTHSRPPATHEPQNPAEKSTRSAFESLASTGLHETIESAKPVEPERKQTAQDPKRNQRVVLPESKSSSTRSADVAVIPTAVARFVDDAEPDIATASQGVVSSATPPQSTPSTTTLGSTLAREVRVIDAARAALRVGDGAQALAALENGASQHLFSRLRQEALILKVEALGTVGRSAEAAALARRNLNDNVTDTQRRTLERWAARP